MEHSQLIVHPLIDITTEVFNYHLDLVFDANTHDLVDSLQLVFSKDIVN